DVTPPGLPTRERVVLVRGDGDPPAPWYDGKLVHLGDVTVAVDRLRTLVRVADGVAGVQDDGTVVVVTPEGFQPLGQARGGSAVVASPGSPGVAWLDVDADLAVARVPPAMVEQNLPLGARLVARDAGATYVALRQDGYLVVDDDGTTVRRSGPVPLDVAGGTQVVATSRGLRVEGGGRTLELVGTGAFGARLSDDGRYLLTSEATSSSSALAVVVDVRDGRTVRLPVPDDGRVVDAAFGGRGVLTLVLSRPEGARFPARTPRGDGAQPGYDLVTCRLRVGTCETAAQLDSVPDPPLVAH
ncbi:MAG: hypothetical protein Q7T52_09395, partial [Nocardioides sp.]|nr:hypothetical protein [Nocardioides sp.]